MKLTRLVAMGAVTIALVFAFAAPVAATQTIKFTICHATSSEAHPYSKISVPEGSSLFPHLSDNEGNSPLAGHEQDLLFEGDVDCPGGVEPTPTPTPTPTPVPTPVQFSLPSFGFECGGSITVTNFDAAVNVDEVLITPGDLSITGDGTFTLEPGDYVAVGLLEGEVVTDEVPFTIEECPVVEPTPTPTPEDSVGAVTATPTLPPTDTLGGDAAPGTSTLAALLVILAGTVASALVLTPHRSRRHR